MPSTAVILLSQNIASLAELTMVYSKVPLPSVAALSLDGGPSFCQIQLVMNRNTTIVICRENPHLRQRNEFENLFFYCVSSD